MTSPRVIKKGIRPHCYQQKILKSEKRFILACAGVQGGKTISGVLWLANLIDKKGEDCNYLLAAPTYKMLHQSTLQKFFEIIGFDKINELGYYHKMDGEIVFRNGIGRLFIRSTEEPNLLEGMTIDGGIWLDEAGQMSEQVWVNCLGRTSIARAPILITTTPYTMNWVYRYLHRPWLRGEKDIEVVHWSSVENPYFPKEEFQQRKESMNETDFARRYLGEWRQLGGLVYPDFLPDKHIIEPIKLNPDWSYFCGVDFGFSNPTCCLWGAKDSDSNYYIFDEYYQRGKTATENVQVIKTKAQQYPPIKAYYCDPTAKDQIHEFIKAGLKRVYGIRIDRSVSIQKVTEFIRTNKLKIFKSCVNLIDELERYHINAVHSDQGMLKEEPAKIDDHAVDALRYLIYNSALNEHPLKIPEPAKSESAKTETVDYLYREQLLQRINKSKNARLNLSASLWGARLGGSHI